MTHFYMDNIVGSMPFFQTNCVGGWNFRLPLCLLINLASELLSHPDFSNYLRFSTYINSFELLRPPVLQMWQELADIVPIAGLSVGFLSMNIPAVLLCVPLSQNLHRITSMQTLIRLMSGILHLSNALPGICNIDILHHTDTLCALLHDGRKVVYVHYLHSRQCGQLC